MDDCFIPQLKRAMPNDLDEIVALARLAATETKTTDWDATYPNQAILSSDIERGALYKVEKDGKIISIMLFEDWETHKIADEDEDDIDTWDPSITRPCALARFCVTPLLQGQGLGRLIMKASLDNAKKLGYDGVRFHASLKNPLALHLYDSMGFHRAGEVSGFDEKFVCYEMKL